MPTIGSDYDLVKAQLYADVLLAWPDVKDVHFGPPLKVKTTGDLPYAVVTVDTVANEFGSQYATVRTPGREWEVTVELVFREPSADQSLLDVKVGHFDALAALLEASEVYATVGMDPLAARADFREAGDAVDKSCRVAVTFTFATRQAWGS